MTGGDTFGRFRLLFQLIFAFPAMLEDMEHLKDCRQEYAAGDCQSRAFSIRVCGRRKRSLALM
jgi:hypothetical protein